MSERAAVKMSTPESTNPQAADNDENQIAPVAPKKSIFSYLMFPPFVVIFLTTLSINDVFQRIIYRFLPQFTEHASYCLNGSVRLCLGVLGARIKTEGFPSQLPARTPYIIVSNHQSMFDIVILYVFFWKFRPRFIAKQELARGIPGVSVCLRHDGSALIDRSNARQALPEIKKLGKRCVEKGHAAIIFPEGTRARTGVMRPFHSAGLTTLLNAAPEATIIPVAIDGSWKFQYFRKGPVPLGIRVHLKVGTPIGREETDVRKLAKTCEAAVQNILAEIRS